MFIMTTTMMVICMMLLTFIYDSDNGIAIYLNFAQNDQTIVKSTWHWKNSDKHGDPSVHVEQPRYQGDSSEDNRPEILLGEIQLSWNIVFDDNTIMQSDIRQWYVDLNAFFLANMVSKLSRKLQESVTCDNAAELLTMQWWWRWWSQSEDTHR